MRQKDINTEIEGEIFRPTDGQTDQRVQILFWCFGKHYTLKSRQRRKA